MSHLAPQLDPETRHHCFDINRIRELEDVQDNPGPPAQRRRQAPPGPPGVPAPMPHFVTPAPAAEADGKVRFDRALYAPRELLAEPTFVRSVLARSTHRREPLLSVYVHHMTGLSGDAGGLTGTPRTCEQVFGISRETLNGLVDRAWATQQTPISLKALWENVGTVRDGRAKGSAQALGLLGPGFVGAARWREKVGTNPAPITNERYDAIEAAIAGADGKGQLWSAEKACARRLALAVMPGLKPDAYPGGAVPGDRRSRDRAARLFESWVLSATIAGHPALTKRFESAYFPRIDKKLAAFKTSPTYAAFSAGTSSVQQSAQRATVSPARLRAWYTVVEARRAARRALPPQADADAGGPA